MNEKVPRRMQRFYRQTTNATNEYSSAQGDEYYSKSNTEKEEDDNFSATGRNILNQLPSMNYEDLDEATKKKYDELKKVEEENKAKELALREVESFKQKNKRLPTKSESEQIAENLYTQLKNVDTEKLYGASQKTGRSNMGRANAKREIAGKRTAGQNNIETELQNDSSNKEMGDIKDLLLDDAESEAPAQNKKSSKKQNEFDLGLDEDLEQNAEIKDIDEEEGSLDNSTDSSNAAVCPNCKKTTENIIYCPKCGTAFCNNCAKKDATTIACPKCGTKLKK